MYEYYSYGRLACLVEMKLVSNYEYLKLKISNCVHREYKFKLSTMIITRVLINRYNMQQIVFLLSRFPLTPPLFLTNIYHPPVKYNIIIVIIRGGGVMCRVRVMTRDFIVMIYIIIIF